MSSTIPTLPTTTHAFCYQNTVTHYTCMYRIFASYTAFAINRALSTSLCFVFCVLIDITADDVTSPRLASPDIDVVNQSRVDLQS